MIINRVIGLRVQSEREVIMFKLSHIHNPYDNTLTLLLQNHNANVTQPLSWP